MPSVKPTAIYQLKITLRASKPPIWRRIQVADNTTLYDLHRIVQDTMGWDNTHLHQFIIDGQRYSDPHMEIDEAQDEKKVRIGDAAKHLGFAQSSKNNLNFEELRLAIENGYSPIVYLRIPFEISLPIQQHAVIVVKADDQNVMVLDPIQGEVLYTIEEFNLVWTQMRGLTILIK